MIGVGVALITALSWAGSSTILKFLTTKIDTLSLNTLRLWVGSIILLSYVFLSGRGGDYLHTPSVPLLYVIASGIIAIAVGDTIYIKSLTFIDVSRSFPIGQCTFPVLTMLVAILFLGETFTWLNVMGALLVVVGLYLVAVVGKGSTTQSSAGGANAKGVILALMAAIAWTVGAAALKIGVTEMDTFVAAAIRIPISAITLTGLVLGRNREGALRFRNYGPCNMGMAAGAGILTYGVAAVGYVKAMQLIGAGRTVLITAVAPIFILPFSILLLKERPTLHAIAGICICVAGVYLVSI